MTVREAMELLDDMQPSPYEKRDVLRWLSTLDGTVAREVMAGHEDMPEGAKNFAGYGEDDMDKALLAPPPYDEMYEHYLRAQVDYRNAETDRYQNSMVMYNVTFQAFADWYNRTHRAILPRGMRTSLR